MDHAKNQLDACDRLKERNVEKLRISSTGSIVVKLYNRMVLILIKKTCTLGFDVSTFMACVIGFGFCPQKSEKRQQVIENGMFQVLRSHHRYDHFLYCRILDIVTSPIQNIRSDTLAIPRP